MWIFESIGKTVIGGVCVNFADGRRLRVIARMSGYRQSLERLAAKDPKLKLLLQMLSKA